MKTSLIRLRISGFLAGLTGHAPPDYYKGGYWKRPHHEFGAAISAWNAGRWFCRWRAPVLWQIGCTSHCGEALVVSPIATKAWQRASRWIAWKIIGVRLSSNAIEEISPTLFGEWWYQSDSPSFGWLSWGIALKRAMRGMPADRQTALRQPARVN